MLNTFVRKMGQRIAGPRLKTSLSFRDRQLMTATQSDIM